MKSDTQATVLAGALLGFFIVLGALLYFGAMTFKCGLRWPDRPHEYRIIAGCMVQADDGAWVPEDRYRVVQ